MKQPIFDATALMYPGATQLDGQEFERSCNLLLSTPDELGKVWEWYARKLGAGVSPVGLGHREFEAGILQIASRRTGRVIGPQAPFSASEYPQALAVRQGANAITIVLSRSQEDGSTRILLFVLVEL
jgi:hypothetical protein